MRKTFLTLFLLFLVFFFSPKDSYANGGVTLNPASGTIGSGGRLIDIVVDSDGKPSDALEVTLKYEGDISFDSFTNGEICDVDLSEREATDDIFIYCFIWGESYVGSDGVLASLRFVPTAEGQGTITITEILVEGVDTATIGSTGTYTTTMSVADEDDENETTPAPTPTPTPTPTPLPQTSLISSVGMILGTSLLLVPVVLNTKVSLNKNKKMLIKLKD